MNQENHPKEVRQNNKGANRDVDVEIVAANSKSGEYVDGKNLRVSSIRSQRQAAEKIRGEELVHSNTLPGSYVSIAVSSVNNHKIEFWVDENGVEDPIIIIDGVIVAKSDKLPFLVQHPLQHDKNESCIGGEIFVTDHNSPPMTFNIGDMIDSLTTNPTKYFQAFNPSLYTLSLDAPLNIPVFKELVNLGGSNGLPVGSYVYSFRYVTADGDRTDWTPPTPPIPVLENVSTGSTTFPGVRTFGGPSNVNNNTNYGVKLKFRISNLANFDFIEIRRQDYNQGIPILTPDSNIIAKIDIVDGEISVREFIDPVDSNTFDAIPEDEEVARLASISRAKAIRYHDKQLVLMNVEFDSQSTDGVTFKDIGTEKAVPVLKKLGKLGYKDPYNHVYNRKYMGGERYGFGIAPHGSLGGSGFVKAIPGFENYQFPNRRDVMSLDSISLSYRGVPTAANVTGAVSEVFEVFDHENAVQKTDRCTFKNIMKEGSKPRTVVNSAGCPDTGQGGTVKAVWVLYNPFSPTSNIDSSVTGLNYHVNTGVQVSFVALSYNPVAFGPDYYSMGLAVGGVENLPAGTKAFSVVRTEPANKIIAQGIGTYALAEGDINNVFGIEVTNDVVSKEKDKLWFHSADLKNLSQSQIDDIINNPGDYQLQLVSPLGFFSEVYHHNDKPDSTSSDRLIDMISYARILHDEGQINPAEDPAMGVGSGGKRYVAHNKYRNPGAASGDAFGGDGNKLFTLKSLSEKSDDDSSYFVLEFNEDIYNDAGGLTMLGGEFVSPAVKSWHEPFYIVNIINTGAEVIDLNIDNYKSTGHFQKMESIIGIGTGNANQTYELVDERWEDCIPDIDPSGPFASFNSYVYMVDALEVSRAWLNVDNKTAAQITAISNDIINNGFHIPEPGVQVYGMYRSTNSNDRDFSILFDVNPYYPASGDKIVVLYDDRRPISVYGGDCVVAENVFAPISRDIGTDYNEIEPENHFILNAPFPHRNFLINPRLFVPDGISTGFPPNNNVIEQNLAPSLTYVRQLLVMFAGESRAAVNFHHNIPEEPDQQSFPLINYVMRPSAGFGAIPNLFGEEYIEDYGPNEINRLTKGGFRFNQLTNVDYQFDGQIEFFSKPDFGFDDRTDFCTAVIWSLPRAVNQQDSPGLKTFLNTNRLDIADDQGEIKKAFDATTGGKGENLYAITEKGVCLLLTKKSILSSIDADDLSTSASDQFISGQYWLSKEIGSDDEMWRGMGEGTIGFVTESGNVEKEILYFPNKQSVYSLVENRITDIGRNEYYSRLNPYLKGLKPVYEGHLTGFINKNNNEYWLEIEGDEDRELFVFGNENGMWEGTFDYRFDNYYMSSNKIFGVRNLETYELEKGLLINGQPIRYELTTAFAPGSAALEKEFIRFGIQSGERNKMKPTRVEFYDKDETLLCSLDTGSQGALYLKQYDGWEQFIGRKDASVSATRDRVQGRTVIVKVIHDEQEDFKIVTTTIQYKVLK